MIATKEGNTELVSLLVDAGASPDIQNKVLHAVFCYDVYLSEFSCHTYPVISVVMTEPH